MSIEADRVVGVAAGQSARLSRPRVRRTDVDSFPLLADGAAILGLCVIVGLAQPGWVAATGLACLAVAGTYRRRLNLSALEMAPRVAVASAATAVVVSLSGGALAIDGFAVVAGSVFVAAMAGRSLGYRVERSLRRSGQISRRAAVIGTGPVTTLLIDTIRAEPAYGLHVVVTSCAPGAGLVDVLRSHRIDTAIIALPMSDDGGLSTVADGFAGLDCEIFLVPQFWQMSPVTGAMQRIGAVPLLRLARLRRGGPAWQFKLALDRCIAALALMLLAPVLAVLAVAVYLSDTSAPVLFRQQRIGVDGRAFELLKFRSLRPENDHESQTRWSISADSRLTPFGRLLRASSLDELPQLWNILRGDMTLVGPRPERPHFVAMFSDSVPGYTARHRVPVGLTGWAAINGLRGDTSIDERARYDNFYIANWTLWFDVTIILRTIAAVVGDMSRRRRPADTDVAEAPCQTR